jgi:hypothetical protein
MIKPIDCKTSDNMKTYIKALKKTKEEFDKYATTILNLKNGIKIISFK